MSIPTLPDPDAVTIAQVAALAVQSREARLACEDLATACENTRRLHALHHYIADKQARRELEGEQRLWEVLIGRLLGPPAPGARTDLRTSSSHEEVIHDQHKADFRTLADHSDLEDLIARGVTKRAQILRRIEEADRRGRERHVTGLVDLRHTDARTLLESLEPASCDLLLTDRRRRTPDGWGVSAPVPLGSDTPDTPQRKRRGRAKTRGCQRGCHPPASVAVRGARPPWP